MIPSSRLKRPQVGRVLCATFAAALVGAVATTVSMRAASAPGGIDVPVPQPILTSNELLAEAGPDECFVDIGVDYPPINPDGTCNEGTPRTNQSYIWGLTEESNKLFYGTMANAACIISGAGSLAEGDDTGFVCEYGESQYAREHPGIPDAIGDWRPPRIYEYDLATDTLRDATPQDALIFSTLGFRGAGSIDNIVFLAGQSFAGPVSNVFAYQADTGEFLGSCILESQSYIRKWETAGGVLYVGVGSNPRNVGEVLRWDGDMSSFEGNFCEDFTVVGRLTAHTANLVVYHGADGQARLAATTVRIRTGTGIGVWISPPLGPDGLTPDDIDGWRQVWSPTSYDPDPIVAQFGYSGGAEMEFDGWLYWGTIHLANSPARRIHESCTRDVCFGPADTPEEEQELALGIRRTTSVWRGRNLESPNREIQLVYGETELPAVNPETGHFEPTPTGWTPLYGHSGFDNVNNQYTWQMAVHGGRLYVGTYDSSFLRQTPDTGADLWRFDSSDVAAVNEDYQGLGDIYNYGIRSMHALDDDSALIAGMANPSNLRPGGGWELRRLKEPAP